MKKSESEIYFTPKQAADYFNLSLSAVKNYIYAGKIRTLKTPGGHHRISKAAILTALGEAPPNTEKNMRDNLRYNLCKAILSLFNTFGNQASYFINHSQNVSRLAARTAKAMDMSESDISMVEMAGLVHDIGIVGIERHIVLKSGVIHSPATETMTMAGSVFRPQEPRALARVGSITPEEYEAIKMHCTIGSQMLSSISELADISDIIMQHHERPDGAGYPNGLSSAKIKEHSKIISVAEAYDAMIAKSFYKITPCSKEKAMEELVKNSSAQFDEETVKVFIKAI